MFLRALLYTEPSSKVFVTDPGAQAIFVADLDDEMEFHNISISGIGHPRFITYDSLSKKIYWSEWSPAGWSQDHRGVCRADISVAVPNKEIVTTSDNSMLSPFPCANWPTFC